MEEPQEYIDGLCRRHGVRAAFGERMLPLAKRSRKVAPDLRKRLLAFIERSFAAEAQRVAAEQPARRNPAEQRLLGTVASVLHDWNPPRWLELWAGRIRDGIRPADET
ncbi:MAG: hypothetical protein O7B99_02570 [Planctomycetota bacterium]|nr:hypothetical protein [Planctomycetota bacterium]